MTTSQIAALGGIIGPVVMFLTWMLARPQKSFESSSSVLGQALEGALATTETMRKLLEPLEAEIQQLRDEARIAADLSRHEAEHLRHEVTLLRAHITALELRLKEMGAEPPPPPEVPQIPPYGRTK